MGFSILCHYFNKKLSSCFPYPLLLFQSETNFPFIFLFSCFILMTVKKPVCQCTTELLLAHELNQFTLNLFSRHFNTNQGIVVSTCVSAHELVYCFRCLWNFWRLPFPCLTQPSDLNKSLLMLDWLVAGRQRKQRKPRQGKEYYHQATSSKGN